MGSGACPPGVAAAQQDRPDGRRQGDDTHAHAELAEGPVLRCALSVCAVLPASPNRATRSILHCPHLQKRKLRHGEHKYSAHGHADSGRRRNRPGSLLARGAPAAARSCRAAPASGFPGCLDDLKPLKRPDRAEGWSALCSERGLCPGRVAQLLGALSLTPRGCRLDSLSAHLPT